MATATTALDLAPLLTVALPASQARSASLPSELRDRYGGDLSIPLHLDRPSVVANFVSTLDGVVSYNTPEAAGGGEISGFFEPDRLVMGLLRSLADVVLIGAGTLRAAPDERWTSAYVSPSSAAAFGGLRRDLGLTDEPMTAVVTASGRVDLAHPGLADPTVPVTIITTDEGAREIGRRPVPSHVEVRALGAAIHPDRIVAALRSAGARLVLCEGGPHLFGQLAGAGLVDELFLTIAPQLAGRSATTPRPGLVEGAVFTVATAPWLQLTDVRRAGSHLFTRYRLTGGLSS